MPRLHFVFFKRLFFFVRPFQVLGAMLSSPCFCNPCSMPHATFAQGVVLIPATAHSLRGPQSSSVRIFLETFLLHRATVARRHTFLQAAANFLWNPKFPRVSSFGSPRRPQSTFGLYAASSFP
jgi:hypothetical protein